MATAGSLHGFPTYGRDATGQDAYVEVVAAAAGHRVWTHVTVRCGGTDGTNDAIISLDGGVTDHIYLPGGAGDAYDDVGPFVGAVQAKNATAGQNFSNLVIHVW